MFFKPTLKKVEKWEKDRNVDQLTKAISCEDLEVRAAIILAMGNLRHRPAIPDMMRMLKHPISSKVREKSVVALGMMRETQAIKDLIKALNDESDAVKRAAKAALISMGEPAYVQIRDQLGDFYHENIRQACRKMLKEFGSRVTTELIAGLQEGTYGIREESAVLLGEIGDQRGRDALIEALADKRMEVRKASADALKQIGWQPKNDLYSAHYYIANDDIKGALAIGSVAIDALVLWLSDDDMKLRRNVAIALRKLGWRPKTRGEAAEFWGAAGKFSEMVKLGSDAVDTLVRLLGDKSVRVKKGAARALTSIGIPRQVRQLVRDINVLADYTFFKLRDGTFNLEEIALPTANHYREKYFLMTVENCDDEQKQHIEKLYPNVDIITEDEAKAM